MTTTLVTAGIDAIAPHPNNPRRDIGDVTELAASIAARGLLEPVVVIPAPAGDQPEQWLLIAGHRRLAAARKAGLAEVPALVRTDLPTQADQVAAMLIENLMRRDLTPVEEAEAFQHLLGYEGWDARAIARATGRSLTTVKSRIKLTRISDAARERVHTGEISLDDADTLASLMPHPDLYAEAEKALGRSDWTWTATRLTRKASERKEKAALLRQARKHGWEVIDAPERAWQVLRDPVTVDEAIADGQRVQVWTTPDRADLIRLRPTPDTDTGGGSEETDDDASDGGDGGADGQPGQPLRHPEARWVRDPGTGAMRYETDDEVAARTLAAQAYAIAADVRAAWMAGWLTNDVKLAPAQQRAALAAALVAIAHDRSDDDAVAALGILAHDDQGDGMESDAQWAEAIARVAAWTLPRLVKTLFAAASGALLRMDGNAWRDGANDWIDDAGRVYAALDAVGYQPTAQEADLLDTAAASWTPVDDAGDAGGQARDDEPAGDIGGEAPGAAA